MLRYEDCSEEPSWIFSWSAVFKWITPKRLDLTTCPPSPSQHAPASADTSEHQILRQKKITRNSKVMSWTTTSCRRELNRKNATDWCIEPYHLLSLPIFWGNIVDQNKAVDWVVFNVQPLLTVSTSTRVTEGRQTCCKSMCDHRVRCS